MLGVIDLVLEPGLCSRIGGQVDVESRLEVLQAVLHDQLVDILPAQVSVTSGRDHFNDPLLNVENGDVQCSSAHVEHSDPLLLRLHLIQSVGDGSCGWLIDDPVAFKTRDLARIKSRLLLHVVEVGRDRNNRILHRSTTPLLRKLLHLLKHLGGNLFGVVSALLTIDLKTDLGPVLAVIHD